MRKREVKKVKNLEIKFRKVLKYTTKNKIVGLLFVLPWIIGFLLFTLLPILKTFEYSLNNVVFTPKSTKLDFVGIQNYVQVLFVTPDFRLQVPGYLRLVFLLMPMILVFSILLATLLNLKIKMRGFFRAVFFFPVILLSPPMLENLFQMEAFNLKGLHDFFVFKFIIENFPARLSSIFMFVMDNIVMCLWLCGVQLLIFVSGMQKIDKSMYEAAMVEGASAWQMFWKITIPTLKPFVLLNAIYTIIDLSTSSLNPITNIITDAMYRTDRGYGFAAAASWLYFIVVVFFVAMVHLVFGRDKKMTAEEKEFYKQKKKIEKLRKAGGVKV